MGSKNEALGSRQVKVSRPKRRNTSADDYERSSSDDRPTSRSRKRIRDTSRRTRRRRHETSDFSEDSRRMTRRRTYDDSESDENYLKYYKIKEGDLELRNVVFALDLISRHKMMFETICFDCLTVF